MSVIDIEREDGLVTLTFDRPELKNALNRESWDELRAALAEVATSSTDRALILAGAGGNFSSGADLSGDAIGETPIVSEMRLVGDIILQLHRLPIPTLAKVDGVAVGVALGLALGCDLVLASDRARLIEIFPRRGLALDGGNSWLLPRLIGVALLAVVATNPYAHFYDALLPLPAALLLWAAPETWSRPGALRLARVLLGLTWAWMPLQYLVWMEAAPSLTGIGFSAWLAVELTDLHTGRGSVSA